LAMTRLNATTRTSCPSTPSPAGCKIRSTRRTRPNVLPLPGPATQRMVAASVLTRTGTWVPRAA
jgi:hypothetical protein